MTQSKEGLLSASWLLSSGSMGSWKFSRVVLQRSKFAAVFSGDDESVVCGCVPLAFAIAATVGDRSNGGDGSLLYS